MRVFAQENYSVVTADNEEHSFVPGDAALKYATCNDCVELKLHGHITL